MRLYMRPVLPLLPAVFLVLSGVSAAQNPNDAVKPVDRKEEWWQKRHQSVVEQSKAGKAQVIFIGDSITQGWEGGNNKPIFQKAFGKFDPVNLGFSGDRTQHVLWRLKEGKELEGIQPKLAVMMIGTNNTGTNTPEEIAAGIEAIIAELKAQRPQMKILLLAVFPRAGIKFERGKTKKIEAQDLNKKIDAVNGLIAKFADEKSVFFLDITKNFLAADGSLEAEVMPDFLHLSAKGYQIWADAVAPKVDELVK